jgi:hypothetical protein
MYSNADNYICNAAIGAMILPKLTKRVIEIFSELEMIDTFGVKYFTRWLSSISLVPLRPEVWDRS